MRELKEWDQYLSLVKLLCETDRGKEILERKSELYPDVEFEQDVVMALQQLDYDFVHPRELKDLATYFIEKGSDSEHPLQLAIIDTCSKIIENYSWRPQKRV